MAEDFLVDNLMQVDVLTPSDEQAYEVMLQEREGTLLYPSLKFRTLLRECVDAEDFYLVAKHGTAIAGALPLFLKRNKSHGNILNSLPFYGSNGGIIVSPRVADPEPVFKCLLDGLCTLALETDAVITTIVTSPLEPHTQLYDKYLTTIFQDSRIGQVTPLPVNDDAEEAVMAMAHSKTRNMVRKAQRSGIVPTQSSDLGALRFLASTHQENLAALGGKAKDWDFFSKVPEVFRYGMDYRVYLATLDGRPISALLVFYYNKTVEYFTPAVLEEFRSLQPNSLLIFEAMKDAMHEGYRYWNFGGTWHSQQGVYLFKKRWGAQDMPYYYYGISHQDTSSFFVKKPTEILPEYPYFYVVPFSEVRHDSSQQTHNPV